MVIVDAANEDYEGEDTMPDEYAEFRDAEGIPVHTGLYVDDLHELSTDYWDRTGQRGAFINLFGMQGSCDVQLHDIAPGEEIERQRHVYDEVVYVLTGNGVTVAGEGENETTFEWSEHSMFALPSNISYKHINTTDDQQARLVAQTPLPQLMNLLDRDFIFECDYDVWGKLGGTGEYYSSQGEEGTIYEGIYDDGTPAATWNSNLIPDVNAIRNMKSWGKVGGISFVLMPFSHSSMYAHVSELPPGLYKKPHRHHPGANVLVRPGSEGYTLLWNPNWEEKKIKVEWKPGSLFTPPAHWWHTHFDLGAEPAGHLALHSADLGGLRKRGAGLFDPHNPENIIEYPDEDPEIRAHYESQLDERDLEFRMPQECYTDPGYEFDL